ncbi:MAG: ABC transporter ATP-binding protein, partial [Hyphomicrobiales bacterium]|nr:ABC transporter ATP-binding protein [Hyphomicrobiales bacterium]
RLNDDLLALVARAGATLLFVTHSVHEAAYLASRALALSPRPGRVVAEVEISGASPRERGFEEGAAYVSACAAIRDALRADAERAA